MKITKRRDGVRAMLSTQKPGEGATSSRSVRAIELRPYLGRRTSKMNAHYNPGIRFITAQEGEPDLTLLLSCCVVNTGQKECRQEQI